MTLELYSIVRDPGKTEVFLVTFAGSTARTRRCEGGERNAASWARADLNCRPHAYQACALTT